MFRKGNPHRYMVSLNGVNRASSTSSSSIVPDIAQYFAYNEGTSAIVVQGNSVNVMGDYCSFVYYTSSGIPCIAVVNKNGDSDTSSTFFEATVSGHEINQITNDGTYFYALGFRSTASTNRAILYKYDVTGEIAYTNLGYGSGSYTINNHGLLSTGGYLIGFSSSSQSTRYGFFRVSASTLASLSERSSSTSHDCRGVCTDGTSIFGAMSSNADILKITISSMAVAATKNLTIDGNAATVTGICTDGTNIYASGIAGGLGYIAKLNLALDTISIAYSGTVGASATLEYSNGFIFAVTTTTIRVFDTSLVYQKTITASGGLTFNIDSSGDNRSQIYADATYIWLPCTTNGSAMIRIKHGLSGAYTSDFFSGLTLTWTSADSFSSATGTTANGTDIWTQTNLFSSAGVSGASIQESTSGISLPASYS